MRERVLRADGDDRLGLRIELYVVIRAVMLDNFQPELGNPARHGIAVIARVPSGFHQLFDDQLRSRAVRIAHPQIHDILLRCACLGLHLVDDGEHIGRQLLDTIELVGNEGHNLL